MSSIPRVRPEKQALGRPGSLRLPSGLGGSAVLGALLSAVLCAGCAGTTALAVGGVASGGLTATSPAAAGLRADAPAHGSGLGPGPLMASTSTVPLVLSPATAAKPYTTVMVTGPASGIRANVLVRLPAAYFDPAQAGRRFPVIETFHGSPGHAPQWLGKLHLGTVLDDRAAAGLNSEAIIVSPDMNYPTDGDHECVDAGPGRPMLETWATRDVPDWVNASFRTQNTPASWAAIGLSTGGWCAAMAAMLHPDRFGAAIVLSGYFHPIFSTAAPFPPSSPLAHRYDLVALARTAPPAVHLWVQTSVQDGVSLPTSRQIASDARPPLTVTETVLTGQDHSWTAWRYALPEALTWLARTSPAFAGASRAVGSA